MGASANFFRQNDCFRMKARPLTLEEVLQLRDGMVISKASESSQPYQIQKFSTGEKVLLALN
jgi:hypothetical protein